ncbi:MAG: 50S ribosomal protein L22 [Thermaerobacter sp.]|nr:50S ribosomal protein L22 [Bacillota bacterium]REJ38368.1 MAG: 50S ribosomal protein L22 [Bacillota bacterium]
MEARAVARYVRLSPRKARLVTEMIRGKSVDEALAVLRFSPQKASRVVEKVLRSAVANATHNLELDEDSLYVARAYVDQGPVLKRWKARARGRAEMRRRPLAHVTVVVRSRETPAAGGSGRSGRKA